MDMTSALDGVLLSGSSEAQAVLKLSSHCCAIGAIPVCFHLNVIEMYREVWNIHVLRLAPAAGVYAHRIVRN
jgi:hypothetical protein